MGLKANQALLARYPVLEYFQYNHLPEGPLRSTSAMFNTLAWKVARMQPEGSAETAVALRKLLEGKDAAVRAALSVPQGEHLGS